MTRKDLNWVFEQCLVKLQGGASLESVLAEYPEWKKELRPVLEAVLAVWESRGSDTVPVAAMTRSRERLGEEVQRRRAVAPKRSLVPRWIFTLRMVTVPAVLLLVTIGLALTGLASVQALPGEPLYQVKLAAERISLSLPASASQKLAREETIDHRRSEEVESLIQQQREQEVFFSGYLTRSADQVWRVDQMVVEVPADLADNLSHHLGRYVYVHADLMPHGRMVLELVEDRLYQINGTIQAVDGMRLRIDGIWVDLSPDSVTAITPQVGMNVTISVVRLVDDHLLAVALAPGNQQPMEIIAMPTEDPGELEDSTTLSTSPSEPTQENNDQHDGSDDSSGGDQHATPEPPKDATPEDRHEERRRTPEPTKSGDDDRRDKTPDPSKSPEPTSEHDD
jgi:hypothetical protein